MICFREQEANLTSIMRCRSTWSVWYLCHELRNKKLKEIKDLRKVWPHEAWDFTPWLAEEDNFALLADGVGLEITI